MSHHLSIIIPTKNRQKYCLECIKHIVSLQLKNVEILVQDNSDDNRLRDDLEKHELLTLVNYNYHPEILSFVRNFSLAIEHSTGEYVTMIGDDDTVLPNITEICKYASENNIDAVLPPLNCYIWPSDNPFKSEYRNGYLASINFKKKAFKPIDHNKALKQLIENNFQEYQSLDVPRLYHGMVKRTMLNEIKERIGDYFIGLTPDMSMSISLCLAVSNAVKSSQPFTISGICPKSGSSDSATGRHTGNLSEAPHFRGHDRYEWHRMIPKVYSVETIWAETAMQVLEEYERYDLIESFDMSAFSAYLYCTYPQFKDEITQFATNYNLNLAKSIGINRRVARKKAIKKLLNKIKKLFTRSYAHKHYNVSTISEACRILCKQYHINSQL